MVIFLFFNLSKTQTFSPVNHATFQAFEAALIFPTGYGRQSSVFVNLKFTEPSIIKNDLFLPMGDKPLFY